MKNSVLSFCYRLFFLFSLLFLAGCGGKSDLAQDQGPFFFPPPPNEPRIQFLKGIGSSEDVKERELSTALITVVGEGGSKNKIDVIAKPYGVATHKGKIFVSDAGTGQVYIFDLVNKTFERLKGNVSIGKLKKPVNLTLDDEGKLFVADTGRKEIMMYDQAGNYLRSFGSKMEWTPADLAIYGKSLFVVDHQNHEIKVFDLEDGKLQGSFGKEGAENKEDNLAKPMGMAFNQKGQLIVSNMITARIVTMDRDGHVLSAFGKMGDGFGQFARPKGVATDELNRIYVVDASLQNVQLFTDKGRLLVFFGERGQARGFMDLPAAIAVTTDNLEYYQTLAAPGFILERVIIVTNQYNKDKVAIYGLGEMKK